MSRLRVAWAVAALVAAACLAYVISQLFEASRLPDDGTDAAGMYMFSSIVVGGILVGLVCVFLWLALGREKAPFPTHPPAGWYADPQLPVGSRYWDGAAWTDRTR